MFYDSTNTLTLRVFAFCSSMFVYIGSEHAG